MVKTINQEISQDKVYSLQILVILGLDGLSWKTNTQHKGVAY